MRKRFLLNVIVVLLLISPMILSGCRSSAPVVTSTLEEGPAPDYTEIDVALDDPSSLVRIQAVKSLSDIKNKSAINKLITIAYDNINDPEVLKEVTESLKKYGDDAREPVRNSLWKEDVIELQSVGFNVLSSPRDVKDKEDFPDFYKKLWEVFIEMPYDPEDTAYRQSICKFLVKNYQRDNEDNIPDLLNLLKDEDSSMAKYTLNKISTWQDSNVAKLLDELYFANKDDEATVLAILQLMNKYAVPANLSKGLPFDISVFLFTFGHSNDKIHKQSYLGLRNFGFNDKDGKIMDYLGSLKQCSNDIIRSNVLAIMQKIKDRKFPEGVEEPELFLPSADYVHMICD